MTTSIAIKNKLKNAFIIALSTTKHFMAIGLQYTNQAQFDAQIKARHFALAATIEENAISQSRLFIRLPLDLASLSF
ncbi:hypothetical protein PS273GM_10265 [Stutzerimonas stutzeri]|uniref:Uncharacterized protein n=1 Tax=Stutzerimonas stutzeri TaxID=316 RepID=A0A172WQD7_STUST|nr:hypothetical protein PS273GM_10265 [Stutzerimonas stutzeri]